MKKGFTLIEVLLVVVILAALAGIVLVAINPARQTAATNDAVRSSHVGQILSAIAQYQVENSALPSGIGTGALEIATGSGANICSALVDTYIAELPVDPTDTDAFFTSCSSYATGYNVSRSSSGRVTVAAPSAEGDDAISVTQ